MPTTSDHLDSEQVGSHAVVVGGSIAGMVAARVLTAHFDRVTLIERDCFPGDPGPRRGVPQSHHIHILLERGMELLEWLFPGLRDELLAAGAVTVRWPRDVLWLLPAGWSRRFPSGIVILSCSRDLLEWCVRRRTLSTHRLECLQERDVVGLLATTTRRRIIGIRHRPRGAADTLDTRPAELYADLIVDASGRDSRTPEWLEELGYKPPEETRVSSFLGYASRLYAIPDGWDEDWKVIYLQPRPPDKPRGGGLFPVEGGRWLVSLGGAAGDYPSTDEDAFLAFAHSLRSPILYDTIKDAEPLTPIRGFRRTENQVRRYDRLRRLPEQLLVTGDAACAFNPIYGQGMSVAAEEAVTLHACLLEQWAKHSDGDLTGLGHRFQRGIARSTAAAWLIATGEDSRYPTTEGAQVGLQTRLMHRYLNRVIRAAAGDAVVNREFVRVINLQNSPTSLFRPQVVWPALRAAPDSDSETRPPESVWPELGVSRE